MDLVTTRAGDGRWRLLALIMATSFANQFNRICMPVAGDAAIIGKTWISPEGMGMVYSSFLLAYALFMTPGGWLIDRVGSRRALTLVGLGGAAMAALTGATGLAFATAATLWFALLAVRFLMGIVSAPVFPAAAAFTRAWFPADFRATANGLIVGASPLGVAACYPIFGYLIAKLGWPSAFLVVAAFTAAIAVVWHLSASDRPAVPVADDLLEGVESETDGWRSLLSDRGILLVTISYTAVGYFQFLFYYWMGYYFKKVLKLPDADWLSSLPPLAMAVGIPLGGWISDRASKTWGPRARGWVAAGGMVVSSALLFGGVLAKDPYSIVAWFSLALGVIGMSESTFWIVAVERGGRRGGTAAGIMNTGGNIGGMLAPVITPFVGERLGWPTSIALGGAVCILGAFLWAFVPSDSRSAIPLGTAD